MIKTLATEYTNLEERKRFLKDNCDSIEQISYMKQFKPEEIDRMKTELSEISIELNDLEEKKKNQSQLIKLEMDPLKEQLKELLTDIKQKAELVKEPVYKFIDDETRMVEYYNDEGNLVDRRPMTMEEKQKTIFQIDRTGTNN